MDNIKANFNDIYSQYYPTEYVNNLISYLKYELPFHAMKRLKNYHQALLPSNNQIRVTMVGSGHGLDAVALKFDVTPQEIFERWTNGATVMLSFPSQSEYEITMVDIEPEPLRFASDVNLCENSFLANMCKPYSVELEKHFNNMTDIVTCIGVTSYIGVEGVEKIIQAAFVNGKAKLFCFSIVKYLDATSFVEICLKYGLIVRKIGSNLMQRVYKDEEERQKVHHVLENRQLLSPEDEQGLICDVLLAYKSELLPEKGDYDDETNFPQTLMNDNQ